MEKGIGFGKIERRERESYYSENLRGRVKRELVLQKFAREGELLHEKYGRERERERERERQRK